MLNKHLIENVPPLSVDIVDSLNQLSGTEGFIYKNHCTGSGSGRQYFTDENGMKCDSIRIELEQLKKMWRNRRVAILLFACQPNQLD